MRYTPEEKVKQYIEEFECKIRDLDNEISLTKDEAKQCVLLCVEKQLDIINMVNDRKYDHIQTFIVKMRQSLLK